MSPHCQVLTDEARQEAAKSPDGLVPVLKERYTVPEPKSIPPGATQEQEGEEGGLDVVDEAGEEQAIESGTGQLGGGKGAARKPATKSAPSAGENAAKGVPRAKKR